MKTATELQLSATSATFVRLTRRGRRLEHLDGVVVGVGRKWLALALDHNAGFAGFALLRVRDVREVHQQSSDGFLQKAWSLEGQWPAPRLEDVNLDRTGTMLRSLGDHRLLSVFYEYEHPDECAIGVPTAYERNVLHLQTINPNAEWTEDGFTLRYRQISRVEVGDAYARRLWKVGGAPPPRTTPRGS